MDNVLDVKSLSKSYADFTLNKISFSLPMGYIMGLIGPNGSGKTTTIKSILNMVKPDNGCITVFGQDNIIAEQEIKKNIGVVFDSSYFVDEWNMSDVEKAFMSFYSAWDTKKYWSLLSKFNITKEKRVKALSKGMQMKLMLACAFSYDATLLILDEPTSGLDPVSRDELLEILSGYIEDGKHSVLFSTHITSDLEKIADYITYINLGELIFTGEKEEFIDGYRIVNGDKKSLEPELESKLIGLRTFTTGYEALIKKEDLLDASQAESFIASIDDIVVFMSRQAEKDKEGYR
ncbi:ABC transporter ATP-binding protein [Clostridioides difficile]|uniref:ABC transporter ATP-binding protein n=1 Tax=Clostridioides difficile TaxID=1496 RepID=UPI00093AE8B1|nr:ABC transporter ATP-binding protein [Clostridioides difficile]AXU70728.1 multidrug ABC transporter ATPase [Clostridioides difficile]MCJ0056392.1 ABC transporter ATP-binding protein [Clostridioides difficile]HBF7093860.1 ABC transporter ATP-binding protein [Clostridioides difficile]